MSMLKQANTILEEFLMLNENVVKLLKASMWDLATCENGEPNVVPVAFKDVTEDGKLVVGDVFLETTLNNVRANGGKIAISVYDAQSLEGYQIKGKAEKHRSTAGNALVAALAFPHAPHRQFGCSPAGSVQWTRQNVLAAEVA